jgi:hypothetical protein
LSTDNDGGVGQYFVLCVMDLCRSSAGKEERGVFGYRHDIPLLFNWFRKIKKDCGQKILDWKLEGKNAVLEG